MTLLLVRNQQEVRDLLYQYLYKLSVIPQRALLGNHALHQMLHVPGNQCHLCRVQREQTCCIHMHLHTLHVHQLELLLLLPIILRGLLQLLQAIMQQLIRHQSYGPLVVQGDQLL